MCRLFMLWTACCLKVKHRIMTMNKGQRMEEKVVETNVWCLLMPLQSRIGSEEQKNTEPFTHGS
jgi:hypothetical protein